MIGIKTEKTTTIKFSQIAVKDNHLFALDRFGDIWYRPIWGLHNEWISVDGPEVLDTEPNF